MIYRCKHPALAQMRVLAQLLRIQNRAGRHTRALQHIHGLDLGTLPTPPREQFVNLFDMVDPRLGT